MAFGSDWPVVPVGPLLAAYVAVNRHAPPPCGASFTPTEAVALEDALTAQTLAGAQAAGIDDVIGSLRQCWEHLEGKEDLPLLLMI